MCHTEYDDNLRTLVVGRHAGTRTFGWVKRKFILGPHPDPTSTMAQVLYSHTGKLVIKDVEIYDAILTTHIRLGHCGRDKMWADINNTFDHVAKNQVSCFLRMCSGCVHRLPPQTNLAVDDEVLEALKALEDRGRQWEQPDSESHLSNEQEDAPEHAMNNWTTVTDDPSISALYNSLDVGSSSPSASIHLLSPSPIIYSATSPEKTNMKKRERMSAAGTPRTSEVSIRTPGTTPQSKQAKHESEIHGSDVGPVLLIGVGETDN